MQSILFPPERVKTMLTAYVHIWPGFGDAPVGKVEWE